MAVTLHAFIEEGLGNAWENLRTATRDLSPEQLGWRPPLPIGADPLAMARRGALSATVEYAATGGAPPLTQANSVGYLLWHMGRVEDNFIQRFILRGDEVWASGGWQEKFGYETRGIGTGFSPEEAAGVPIPPTEVLWGYLDDVRARTLRYLAGLDWATLQEKPRAERFPQWSIQTILRQLSAHANQHLGEINYLRGLMGLGGALG